ncbi:MAG: RrF2 family transcriptional regulator, partial [Dehalococcoidia bacterium]
VSMLHISRQTDYGLRLMVEIASNDGGPITTIEVARRQDVPYQFLRKVARSLVAAGLLVSNRGTGGGLSLARPPDSVTMLDIVDALETVALNDCTAVPPRCERRDRCAVFPVWVRAQASVEGLLTSNTLSELATKQTKLSLLQKATTALTAAPPLACQAHTGGR